MNPWICWSSSADTTPPTRRICRNRGEPWIRSFHIDTPDRLDSTANTIEHKPLGDALTTEADFLPAGPVTVGITSGASTRTERWKR